MMASSRIVCIDREIRRVEAELQAVLRTGGGGLGAAAVSMRGGRYSLNAENHGGNGERWTEKRMIIELEKGGVSNPERWTWIQEKESSELDHTSIEIIQKDAELYRAKDEALRQVIRFDVAARGTPMFFSGLNSNYYFFKDGGYCVQDCYHRDTGDRIRVMDVYLSPVGGPELDPLLLFNIDLRDYRHDSSGKLWLVASTGLRRITYSNNLWKGSTGQEGGCDEVHEHDMELGDFLKRVTAVKVNESTDKSAESKAVEVNSKLAGLIRLHLNSGKRYTDLEPKYRDAAFARILQHMKAIEFGLGHLGGADEYKPRNIAYNVLIVENRLSFDYIQLDVFKNGKTIYFDRGDMYGLKSIESEEIRVHTYRLTFGLSSLPCVQVDAQYNDENMYRKLVLEKFDDNIIELQVNEDVESYIVPGIGANIYRGENLGFEHTAEVKGVKRLWIRGISSKEILPNLVFQLTPSEGDQFLISDSAEFEQVVFMDTLWRTSKDQIAGCKSCCEDVEFSDCLNVLLGEDESAGYDPNEQVDAFVEHLSGVDKSKAVQTIRNHLSGVKVTEKKTADPADGPNNKAFNIRIFDGKIMFDCVRVGIIKQLELNEKNRSFAAYEFRIRTFRFTFNLI